MWTYNAYAGTNRAIGNSTYNAEFGEGSSKIKRWNGAFETSSSYTFLAPVDSSKPAASSASRYFWVGSGNTAPTVEDYKLEIPYTHSQFKWVESDNSALIYDAVVKKYKTTAHTILQNISGSALDIKEIGIITASTSISNTSVLYYREVLETPITVPAGEYVRIEMDVETPAYVPTPSE